MTARGGTRVGGMPQWKRLATPARTDLALATGLFIWGLPDVPWWWEPPGHAGSAVAVLGALMLTLAMSVPFCWRRRFPVPVLALALAVLVIRAVLHRDLTSAFAAVLIGAYGLGAYAGASRRYARWLGWLALATAVVTVLISNGDRFAAAPFALLAAALVLGDAASARRAETAAAVEAAHQAERTRIARELHDVVAHQLSAIAVQAGAARIAGSGGTDRPVLATVERLAREALSELNHLLGALRREPAGDPDRPPAPTLAELPALLASAESAGVPAQLTVEGPARCLPGSSCPATGSWRRRWPTWPGTRPARRPRCCCGTGHPRSTSRFTTAPGRIRPGPARAGGVCRACGNGPSCMAANWWRVPGPAAVSR